MKAGFNIHIDLNGWTIPFRIEKKGYGVFKVAYANTSLGYLMLDEFRKWLYVKNVGSEDLLNHLTRCKISEAIINY